MRLDAYYYGFDSTGNDAIDLVLSAVACAGKAFHNTDCWADEADPSRYNERLRGATMVEGIQNAANDAAKLLADRDAEIERLRADLVWAVRHQAALYHDTPVKHVCFWIDEGWRESDEVECDGTPDSICRAVREARDGVS